MLQSCLASRIYTSPITRRNFCVYALFRFYLRIPLSVFGFCARSGVFSAHRMPKSTRPLSRVIETTAAFRRYAMKTVKKPICILALGLPRLAPMYIYTLGAQEVTTNDTYRLPAPAINYSPCQTLREVIAGDRE